MRITVLSVATVSLGIALSNPAEAQSISTDFDIVGVKFGMTADEVKQALSRYDSKMAFRETSKWTRTPTMPESLATLTACGHGPAALPDQCAESVTVTFGQANKVAYFIRRVVRSESHLKQAEVANAIFDKYHLDGARLKSTAIRTDWFNWWLIDSRGTLTYGSSPYCAAESNDGSAPTASRPTCNIAAFVNVHDNAMKPGFNDKFEVAATSHAVLQREISAQHAMAAAQDRAERAKLEGEVKAVPKM